MSEDTAAIRNEMLRQLEARGADKSICPSEVARALSPEWRGLLKPVRVVAIALAGEGRLDILRKGRPVEQDNTGDVKGVIRLRLRPPFD